ncbi:MAG: A/G-specific adenine glycosylase [Chloroflexi bacterium]|nr:A/G-specific adenine glycosylase [Chloroflexota bacterium]
MADLAQVQAALVEWYGRHARDLPWRQTCDPYAILVAEVMLQQTQVDRVLPKWRAWLEQFPTLGDLAAATRADAIRAWQGLGYNLRAVRLHEIACQAVAEFGGQLPRTMEQLLTLKGVGRYTAAAVACFALGEPVAPVDTNIRRVLGRVFSLEPQNVEAIAQSLVPLDLAYEWNQALMDLGATLCRPRQPLCLVCPLVSQCGGPRATIARRRQGEFSGSNRYYRGRILDALRQSDGVPLEELVASHGGRRDLIDRLTVDGLIEIENGLAHLPA